MVKEKETECTLNFCVFTIIFIYVFFFNMSCGKIKKDNKYSSFPFKLKNSRIVVSALLNNNYVNNFLVDTSIEEGIIIDFRLAKKADIKPINADDFYYWIRKDPKSEYYTLESFGFPGREFEDLNCFVTDLVILEKKLGERINGIIGSSFLKNFLMEFDFKHNMIHLYSEFPSSNREYIKVKLDKFPNSENKRILTGVTDKNLITSFIFNTGSPVTIYPYIIAKELLKQGKALQSHYIEIAGQEYSLLKIGTLTFNGFIMAKNRQVVYISPSKKEELPLIVLVLDRQILLWKMAR